MKSLLNYCRVRIFPAKISKELQLLKNSLELRKYLFAQKILEKGDTAIDIGAHLGLYTQLFAHCVGDTGRVFSYEPNPYVFSILKKSVRLKNMVHAGKIAISDGSFKTMEMKLHPYSLAQSSTLEAKLMHAERMPGRTKKVSVPSASLDHLFRSEDGKIKLIKIDVEGHEERVVNGAFDIIEKNMPYIIFEYGVEPGVFEPATLELLKKHHYICYDFNDLQPIVHPPQKSYLTDIVAIPPSKISEGQDVLQALAMIAS